MEDANVSTTRKALTINLDDHRYGTFAEIGAGQEVARYFFQAGKASNTVAKTMSAYDKVFSEEIYGKSGRFVSQERLTKMLDHEFELLRERLHKARGAKSSFFVFASTVATSSHEDDPTCHGWIGVAFQLKPGGCVNHIKLHVKMKDRMRLQQSEALGILGVNLLFSSFYLVDVARDFLSSLLENLDDDRIDLDFIEFTGKDIAHIDNRLVGLELVERGTTRSMMFNPAGSAIQAADHLYKKPLIVQRGTFRPITHLNQDIMNAGCIQMKQLLGDDSQEPLKLLEISLKSVRGGHDQIIQDYLDRIDTLCALGYHVLISKFPLYHELKSYLRKCTDGLIVMLAGAKSLEQIFNKEHYVGLRGGTLEAFGKLFDQDTLLYIYPYKTDKLCLTAETFTPSDEFTYLYKHLLFNKNIVDLMGCDDLGASVDLEDIQLHIQKGDDIWEKFVPQEVVKLIKEKKIFGYKSK